MAVFLFYSDTDFKEIFVKSVRSVSLSLLKFYPTLLKESHIGKSY